MKRAARAALLACGLLACGLSGAPAAAPAEPTAAQHLPKVPLAIRTAHRTLRFRVEVARTPDQQEIGLMFRKTMAANEGMIFPMAPARPASFWMHNTYIPLDIVFVRADGTIASIAANATPLSDATLESIEPVGAVLELNGGTAARDGIHAGDRVRW